MSGIYQTGTDDEPEQVSGSDSSTALDLTDDDVCKMTVTDNGRGVKRVVIGSDIVDKLGIEEGQIAKQSVADDGQILLEIIQ